MRWNRACVCLYFSPCIPSITRFAPVRIQCSSTAEKTRAGSGGHRPTAMSIPICFSASMRACCSLLSISNYYCLTRFIGYRFTGCAAGTYPSDNSGCVACTGNAYSAGGYATICTSCPSGAVTAVTGCVCVPGYAGATGWQCAPCPAGNFCPSNGTQIACPKGLWGNVTGAANVSTGCPYNCSAYWPCPVGYYVSRAGCGGPNPPTCGTCAAGSYALATACSACAPGYYQNNPAQPSCAPAPAGAYQSAIGATGYSFCPAGTYQSAAGSTFCAFCAAGKYPLNTSSGVCTACPASLYGCGGACVTGACELCPSGVITVYNYVANQNLVWVIGPANDAAPAPTIALAITSTDGTYRTFQSNLGSDILFVYDCAQFVATCLIGLFTGSYTSNPVLPPNTQHFTTDWIVSTTGVLMLRWVTAKAGPMIGWQATWVSNYPPCLACNYGYVPSSKGCAACGAGTYSPPGFALPQSSYMSWNMQGVAGSACAFCPAGWYQPYTNQSACQICGIGLYQPNPGATTCFSCLPGYYTNGTGATTGGACGACGAGSYGLTGASPYI